MNRTAQEMYFAPPRTCPNCGEPTFVYGHSWDDEITGWTFHCFHCTKCDFEDCRVLE